MQEGLKWSGGGGDTDNNRNDLWLRERQNQIQHSTTLSFGGGDITGEAPPISPLFSLKTFILIHPLYTRFSIIFVP